METPSIATLLKLNKQPQQYHHQES